MNQKIQTIFHYHETTKHSQQRYARSLGYMDWATQPNPFREYNGAKKLELPIALDNATPPYHLLDSDLPSAPLCKESLSQLMQFSMGIAAWKESGPSSWAVRCNASSGNLHPTEAYLITPPLFDEQENQSSVMHYTPYNHGLEILASFDTDFFNTIPQGSFLLVLSSISWREVWKYGERAFRYVHLDTGHAWQSVNVSAKMLGWNSVQLDSLHNDDINTLIGVAQSKRFFETELGDIVLLISPQTNPGAIKIDTLLGDIPLQFDGIANKLSPAMQSWDIIPAIEQATHSKQLAQTDSKIQKTSKEPTLESKDVVLRRRSVHVMDPKTSDINQEQFHTILRSVAHSLDAKQTAVHLCLMVHRVKEYEQGLYILVRNTQDLAELQNLLDHDFLWETTNFENLYFLQKKDYKALSKTISCSQDIASDGAFSLGMLCRFSKEIQEFGPHRYKELYWECGMIGQQLYLEATSLGLSGTGIGCFLDDMMHNLLRLQSNQYQILYHFTVGRGYVDSRILTKSAYSREI